MSDKKSAFIIFAFSLVPYVVVSWIYTKISEGSWYEFWTALGVLVVIRIFFSIIETSGSILAWRFYGKKLVINRNLTILRSNNFPKRKYADDDFLSYLTGIQDDLQSSPHLKSAAKEWYFSLSFFEGVGILLGARMHAASDEALDIYSPKPEAPVRRTRT